jgi:undecaprenyl-diphosphatase
MTRFARRGVIAVSAAGFVLGAHEARTGVVRPVEARCFELVNGLSGHGFAPVWVVMQVGSLAGSVGLGLLTGLAGRRRLGSALVGGAVTTWLAAKAVKPCIQRGRPTAVIGQARVLGREQAGLGYPSGHAAVATALAAAALPHVDRALRAPLLLAAAGVGTARVYVGAHLPLDVVGGMALGLAIGTVWCPRGPA